MSYDHKNNNGNNNSNNTALIQLLQALAEGQAQGLERLEAIERRLQASEDWFTAVLKADDAQKTFEAFTAAIEASVRAAHADHVALVAELKERSASFQKALERVSAAMNPDSETVMAALLEALRPAATGGSVRSKIVTKVNTLKERFREWNHNRLQRKLEKLQKAVQG